MKNKFLLLLFFTSQTLLINAQMVGSKSYAIMLKGLLSHTVNEISADQASSRKDSAVFIDSREKKEYEVSHIADAIWVGYDNLNLKKLKKLDKDAEIIVYCSVGYRSEKVAEKLKAKGFKNVSNMYGGIFEWKNKEMPLVNSENQPTDSVHAYNKIWGIWVNKGVKVY